MRKIRRFSLGRGMQLGAVVCCLIFAFRGRPPANAEADGFQGSAATSQAVKDARQDDAISNLRERADTSDDVLGRRIDQAGTALAVQGQELAQVRDDVAELRGENRAEFGGIAILGGGGMLLSRRRRRDPEAE